jgi:curved DNA-binding protein CbpA
VPDKNHYEVLRLARTATQADIDAQYHEFLFQFHPDRNPGDEERSVEKTIALVDAYHTLSDPQARKLYDFRIINPLIEQAQVKGMKLLKSKEKKEAEALFIQGVRLANDELDMKAVEAFKAALKLEPNFPEAAHNLALLGALMGNQNFSVEIIARALAATPEDPALLRLRKNIHSTFSGG